VPVVYNRGVSTSTAVPGFSVIIPNYNGAPILEACLGSLARQLHPPAEVLVIDNASQDNSLEVIRKVTPSVRVVAQSVNRGYAAAVNIGARTARSEWLAVLNNDTEVAPGWIRACLEAAERHPDASFFAPRVLDFQTRNRIDSAGDCLLRAGIGFRRGHGVPDGDPYGIELEVFAASGSAAVYRKSAFDAAGGFDERFFAYLEDVDLGLRLRAQGHRGYYVPAAIVYHRGGVTSGGEFSPLSVRLRTRNALLLLLKNYPPGWLVRCAPMVLAAQFFWLARVLAHNRFLSYLAGLVDLVAAAPYAMRQRRRSAQGVRAAGNALWQAVRDSESMARRDFCASAARRNSLFLRWYFRLF
jgi:GT2 family glycosyltransferase